MKRYQLIRIVKTVLACSLAAVMGFMNPARSLAAGQGKEYISEVRLSTAKTEKEAREWLQNNGYTVMKMLDENKKTIEQDLNKGTGKDPVVLGYKTTTDPNEAITDMAVMDMDGGYSFSEYGAMLEREKEGVQSLVKALQAALKEYRSNYKADRPGAKKAYKMMNRLKEDDSGKLMGEFLLNDSLSEDDLVKVIMQGNSIAMFSVYRGLALGCSESDTDNWLKRLSDIGPDDSLSPKYDNKAREIYDGQWDKLREQLLDYKQSGLKADASEEEVEKWKKGKSKNAYTTWMQNAATYQLLASYSYGDGTLADFFITDKEEKEDEMGMEAFYPIAAAMTEGQRAISKLVGLDYMIQVAGTSKKTLEKADKEAEKTADKMVKEEEEEEEEEVPEVVSIYAGVDRSLFDGGVALTNEAMQKSSATGDNSWWQGNLSKGAEIALYAVAGTFAVLGITIISIGLYVQFHSGVLSNLPEIIIDITNWLGDIFHTVTNTRWTMARLYYGIGGVALAIALIVAGVYLLLEWYNYSHPEFTEIPRILVDERKDETGKSIYINYYAAKDQNGELADLNAWKGKKWNTLYTTKDKNAGNPITTDIFCQLKNNVPKEQYSPVHKFGQKAAFNLNKNCFSDKKGGIYFFFASDAEAYDYSGSAFSVGQIVMTSGLGALVGILIGTLLTTMAGKRKKKKKPVTV